jgi:hypothetical protein
VTVADYCNADTMEFVVDIWPCGNADGLGGVDIDDVVFLINFIFVLGSPAPDPLGIGDADCSDGEHPVDVDDVVYLIQYIFAFGPVPCANCPY